MSESTEFTAIVSVDGRVAIPRAVRARLGLTRGSIVRFVLEAGGVRLLPAAGDIRRLKGRLTVPKKPFSLEDMNRAIAERRAKTSGP